MPDTIIPIPSPIPNFLPVLPSLHHSIPYHKITLPHKTNLKHPTLPNPYSSSYVLLSVFSIIQETNSEWDNIESIHV